MVSLFDRAGSLARGLRRKPISKLSRRDQDRRLRLAIDQLESRLALAITTPLEIGGTTVGTFTDSPTGIASLGDFVTVSIEGTRGTVVFNGGKGVADGSDIQTIEILDASPDFQLTFSAAVQTANAVPYGSDGIVQLGQITTANVIRGINTVRGLPTNVAVTTTPPIGFNQASPGGGDAFTVEGNQLGTWSVGSFVALSPLPPSSPVASPVFGKIISSGFDGGTNLTTLRIDNSTPTGTTAGALTLASTVEPYFVLTSFEGVNFSNVNQKGGGLFVDSVVGNADNLGILLSQGLLAYSTIGIRDSLDAAVVLGTQANASADGRMLVGTATADSLLFVGPRTRPTAKNSRFQLTSQTDFDAGVFVAQAFDGVVNVGGDAGGNWVFARGVGRNAVLNANSWAGQTAIEPFLGAPTGVSVVGDFAGTINSIGRDIALSVSRNITGTARVNSHAEIALKVGGSIQKGAVVSANSGVTFDVAGSVLGTIQAGSSVMSGAVGGDLSGATLASSDDITLAVAGGILNSRLAADDEFTLSVAKNVTNSTLSSGDSEISFSIGGNVVNSRFLGGLDGTIAGNVTKSLFAAKGDDLDDVDDPDITLEIGGSLTDSHIEATSLVSVDVNGNVTRSKFFSTTSDVTLDVGGDIRNSQLIAADDGVELTVGRDALGVLVIGDDADHSLDIGRNFSGTVQNGSGDVTFDVGGSVLKGSSITTGGNAVVDGGGTFDGSVTSQELRFFVDGNVSQASRITAQAVTDWQGAGTPNFGIGGRFDGIVNVVNFDAAPGEQNVTLVGGGAGSSARINVERFSTDTLTFNGDYLGNLRVNQDLVANLNFLGNAHRISIGGRVGSYTTGNTTQVVPVSINVAKRLLFLNSNSYFQAAQPGKNGTFYNDSTSTTAFPSLPATGILSTGSYVTVVPTRPAIQTPTPIPPQTYTAPTAPTGFSAKSQDVRPAGILVTFGAATSDGGLPVVFYEYSTNATDGTPTWRRFDDPAQGPGTDIVLTKDSGGNALVAGTTYQVAVRAVNAVGATPTAASAVTVLAPPLAPATFSASATTPPGIKVSFTAPTNGGGLPLTYEYTTNALAAIPDWRAFDTAAQGPGTDIQLTVDSSGGAWLNNTYDVSVRAVNSLGNAAFTPSAPVTVTGVV